MKVKIFNEIGYLLAVTLMALSVAIINVTGLGLSMIVAPAYLISLKVDWLSFGQADYLVEAFLLILLFIIVRRFKIGYFFAFITCLIYGLLLDLFTMIPILQTNPEDIALWLRIIIFIGGNILTCLAVSLFIHVYLPPQVYDLFVKEVTSRFHFNFKIFKTIFDISMLVISIVMSYLMFQSLQGVGIGTFVVAFLNGTGIGLFNKMFDKFFEFPPVFKKITKYFEIE